MKNSKIPLTPGAYFQIDLFESQLRKAKGAKKKFLKENESGFYSYSLDKRIPEEDVKILLEIVEDRESIYKYFNTEYMPFDIEIRELYKEEEKVKSNSIYDLMAAKSVTCFEGRFKITTRYGQPPITVTRQFLKDTTLSMRGINNFM